MNYIYRPIEQWPGELCRSRKSSTFKSLWGKTLELLDAELRFLKADNVVFQIAISEDFIRLDGKLRPGAKTAHPGVIISFDSAHGPLSYPCDTFTDFQDNVRAIALALEALRKVQRYGVGMRGEQYTGWKSLPPPGGATMTRDEAMLFLLEFSEPGDPSGNPDKALAAYRRALGKLHPERNGGDDHQFKRLQEAKRLLGI